jgi:hypothetical protein
MVILFVQICFTAFSLALVIYHEQGYLLKEVLDTVRN